jgi:parvulin-like peptidyl-prolyl isomerase
MRQASRRVRTAAWIGVAVTAASVAAAAPQVVAELGPRQITAADVRTELRELRTSGEVATLLKTMDATGRADVVDQMVIREQYALAARAEAMDKRSDTAAEIDRAVTKILAARYAEAERAKADVSEAVLRGCFDAHRADFQSKPRVRARQILVKTRAEADAIAAAIEAGADFVELAATRSQDPYTRGKGGELGWISEGLMVKSFEDVLFALEPGHAPAVAQSGHGFHVIRVDAVEPAAARGFESVRDRVIERVQEAHLRRVQQKLNATYPVKLFPEALKALER